MLPLAMTGQARALTAGRTDIEGSNDVAAWASANHLPKAVVNAA